MNIQRRCDYLSNIIPCIRQNFRKSYRSILINRYNLKQVEIGKPTTLVEKHLGIGYSLQGIFTEVFKQNIGKQPQSAEALFNEWTNLLGEFKAMVSNSPNGLGNVLEETIPKLIDHSKRNDATLIFAKD